VYDVSAGRLWRWLAGIAAALALAGHLASFALKLRDPALHPVDLWRDGALMMRAVPLALIALAIVARGRSAPGVTALALALALTNVSWADGHLANAGVTAGGLAREIPLSLVSLAAAALYVRCTQLFPKPLDSERYALLRARWRRAPVFADLLRALDRPATAWGIAVIWQLTAWLGAPDLVDEAIQLVLVALGAVYWFVQARTGDPLTSRQVAWFAQGVLAFLILWIIGIALRQLIGSDASGAGLWLRIAVGYVSAIMLVVAFAIGIFRAGAVSPDLVLRATFIYGLLATVLLLALHAILDFALDDVAEALGLSDRIVAALMGAMLALALEPLAHWLRSRMRAHAQRRMGLPVSLPPAH
jgi:hypothetical protein